MSSPRYRSGIYTTEIETVAHKGVFWDCDFLVPEEIREKMPLEESGKLHRTYCLSLHSSPEIGHILEFNDLEWRVTEVRHFPTRKGAKGIRRLSRLAAEYVGQVEH